MAKSDVLYDHPRSKAARAQQEAKKGDVVKGKDLPGGEADDESEWESVGEKWLGKNNELEEDVDPDELSAKADEKGQWKGKGIEPIRVKDSEGGRRREYFKKKPAVPTS